MTRKNIYNRFQTKEKLEKIHPENKALISDYMLEAKSRGKAEGTIKQYHNDLKIFACYVLDNLDNMPFSKVKKKHLRNYVLYLQEKGQSGSRINRQLSSIRTMLEYATEDEDYEDDFIRNYASKIKGLPNKKVREICFLNSKDIEIIHSRLMSEEKYSQALLLALLIDSGARRSEVYQVKKSSITEDGGLTNKVIGKGGKEFKLLYNKLTKETFKPYIEQRGDDEYDYLWYKKDSNGVITEVTNSTLYDWVTSWRDILEEETGEKKDFNVHSFRHSALEQLHGGDHYILKEIGAENMGLETLQVMANHNDISTTKSYLKDKSEDELLQAFKLK